MATNKPSKYKSLDLFITWLCWTLIAVFTLVFVSGFLGLIINQLPDEPHAGYDRTTSGDYTPLGGYVRE
jgi:hypothetical protein